MTTVDSCAHIETIRKSITDCEQRFQREPNSTTLLAVSKTKPAEMIVQAYQCGLRAFGENYAQELYDKACELDLPDIEWHFIGPLQSNKTRLIAEKAAWMHSVDRLKIATRLSDQRPAELPPLQICLQVNLENESGKSGLSATEVKEVAKAVAQLPHLQLRGLMSIPVPHSEESEQRRVFAELRQLMESLNADGFQLDTLSMGMTADYPAAIAEGSTIIRIGTALFGARN